MRYGPIATEELCRNPAMDRYGSSSRAELRPPNRPTSSRGSRGGGPSSRAWRRASARSSATSAGLVAQEMSPATMTASSGVTIRSQASASGPGCPIQPKRSIVLPRVDGRCVSPMAKRRMGGGRTLGQTAPGPSAQGTATVSRTPNAAGPSDVPVSNGPWALAKPSRNPGRQFRGLRRTFPGSRTLRALTVRAHIRRTHVPARRRAPPGPGRAAPPRMERDILPGPRARASSTGYADEDGLRRLRRHRPGLGRRRARRSPTPARLREVAERFHHRAARRCQPAACLLRRGAAGGG